MVTKVTLGRVKLLAAYPRDPADLPAFRRLLGATRANLCQWIGGYWAPNAAARCRIERAIGVAVADWDTPLASPAGEPGAPVEG
jgi:hypothetical protein